MSTEGKKGKLQGKNINSKFRNIIFKYNMKQILKIHAEEIYIDDPFRLTHIYVFYFLKAIMRYS